MFWCLMVGKYGVVNRSTAKVEEYFLFKTKGRLGVNKEVADSPPSYIFERKPVALLGGEARPL